MSHWLCDLEQVDPLPSQPQCLSFISSRAFHRAQKVPETVLGWCSLSVRGSDDDDINNNIHISIREEVRINEIRKYKCLPAHTAIFNTDNQQGPIVLHMELCSMLCDSLDGREVWRRLDTCIYVAESLCCPAETVTTLLIGYISIQKKKLKKTVKCQTRQMSPSYLQMMANTLCFYSQCCFSKVFSSALQQTTLKVSR